MGTEQIPEFIQDRYRVIRRLGSGSSGIVFVCQDTKLGASTRVAVKLFPKEASGNKNAAARIRRELLSAFEVNHDNVVRFYEPVHDHDRFGYSMEYVEGASLEDIIREGDSLDLLKILDVLGQICNGLEAIHHAGIIHRDIKPANVLLTGDGIAKITDLGLAKNTRSMTEEWKSFSALAGVSSKVTQHGEVPGTPDYISPEYVEHGSFDRRSDLYAVGVIGYELLTGRVPFFDSEVAQMMRQKVEVDPPPPTKYFRDCPPALSNCIMQALQRDPTQRFQTAREMRDVLFQVRDELLQQATGIEVKNRRDSLRRSTGNYAHGHALRASPLVQSLFIWVVAVFTIITILISTGNLPSSTITHSLVDLPGGQWFLGIFR